MSAPGGQRGERRMPGSSHCQDAVCIQEHGGPAGVEQLSIAPNAIVSEHQIHLDYWRGASCHFTSRITPGQTTWDRSGTSYPSHGGPPPPLASGTCQNLPSHHRVKPAAGPERHIIGLAETLGRRDPSHSSPSTLTNGRWGWLMAMPNEEGNTAPGYVLKHYNIRI